MKLKINKACDLSSISVLPPPQSRRPNALASGTESSFFGNTQASQLRQQQQSQQSFSQLRQQQSQQSFSQAMSSQFSQSSLDEILTNEQRFGSQDKENSTKRISCLAPVAYRREETPVPMSRSSNNLMHRWSSAPAQDYKCQVSEELEHRIGLMETSLNRFGMILDSVQSDVMQVNKAIKEVSLETEGIKKKLIVHDGSLQLMLTGEEDIKATLDGSLKSIPGQVIRDLHQYKLEETVLMLSALPEKIEARLLKMQSELSGAIAKEMETIVYTIRSPKQNNLDSTLLPQATASSTKSPDQTDLGPTLLHQRRNIQLQSQSKQVPVPKNSAVPIKAHTQKAPVPLIKAESPGWLRPKSTTLTHRQHKVNYKQGKIPSAEKDRECGIIIASDEESDEGFSCLLVEKEAGMQISLLEEVKDETERILRKARKRKRKHCNPIIIH